MKKSTTIIITILVILILVAIIVGIYITSPTENEQNRRK